MKADVCREHVLNEDSSGPKPHQIMPPRKRRAPPNGTLHSVPELSSIDEDAADAREAVPGKMVLDRRLAGVNQKGAAG